MYFAGGCGAYLKKINLKNSVVLQIHLWEQEKKYLDLAIHEAHLFGHKFICFCQMNT